MAEDKDYSGNGPLIVTSTVAVLSFAAFLFMMHLGRKILPPPVPAHHLQTQTPAPSGASASTQGDSNG